MTNECQLPDGFAPFPDGVGFANSLGQLYLKRDNQKIILGLSVEQHHLNGIALCHGGVLMMLADICCAWNIRSQLKEGVAPPTLALSFDFMTAARAGDWLETRLEMLDVKRRVGFAGGTIVCGDKNMVRFNGTFYIPEHEHFKMSEGIKRQYDSVLEK